MFSLILFLLIQILESLDLITASTAMTIGYSSLKWFNLQQAIEMRIRYLGGIFSFVPWV